MKSKAVNHQIYESMLSLNDILCHDMEQFNSTERTSPKEKARLLLAFVQDKKRCRLELRYEGENIG